MVNFNQKLLNVWQNKIKYNEKCSKLPRFTLASDGWCTGKLAKKRSIVVGMNQDTSTQIHLLTLMQISIALSPSFPRPENIPSEQSARKMTLSRPLNKVAKVPPSFSSSSSTTASPQALPQFQPDVVEVEPLWYPPQVAIFN